MEGEVGANMELFRAVSLANPAHVKGLIEVGG